MPGFFKVERDFLDKSFWLSEKFTRAQAWIDLIGIVNHEKGFFFIRGIKIDLERGQTGRSELTLSKRWQWSRNKVRRFLKWLENEGMILQKKDNKTSIITICNYNIYQANKNINDTASETTNDTPERHQKDTRKDTNKNVKKKENEKIKDIVDYLNQKTGSKYKHTTNGTKKYIEARIKEGFSIDDFKKVIDVKTSQWINTDQSKYLRPETLFGNKFEGYLNENIICPKNSVNKLSFDKYKEAFKFRKDKNINGEFKFKEEALNQIIKKYPQFDNFDFDSDLFKNTYSKYLTL